jgi:hypothetical protein
MNSKKGIKDPEFMVLAACNLDHQEEVSGVLHHSHEIRDNYFEGVSPTKVRSVSDEIVQHYNLQEQIREERRSDDLYNSFAQQRRNQMESKCQLGQLNNPSSFNINTLVLIPQMQHGALYKSENITLKTIKKIKNDDNSKRQDDQYEADDAPYDISTNSAIKNKGKKTVTFEP